jgi:hypothetical protein
MSATYANIPNKEMSNGEGSLICSLGHTTGRSKVSTQPIFSYLQGTSMSFGIKQIRITTGAKGMHH